MSKTFDDLFNEFLKNLKKEAEETEKLDLPNASENSDDVSDLARKLIDMISNANPINEEDEDAIDNTLGKPDKIEFYNEDNMFFEKRIWYVNGGELIKIIVSDEPSLNIAPKPKKSLQEQLDIAVENEEFEKAATLRDKMNKPKVRKTRAKNKTK